VTVEDHLKRFAEIYRGYSSWLRVDPANGHIALDQSFQVELPPYNQDLADAGKGPSYGWGFINSYNSEMATVAIVAHVRTLGRSREEVVTVELAAK
jgi:nitrous-oxide reductase